VTRTTFNGIGKDGLNQWQLNLISFILFITFVCYKHTNYCLLLFIYFAVGAHLKNSCFVKESHWITFSAVGLYWWIPQWAYLDSVSFGFCCSGQFVQA